MPVLWWLVATILVVLSTILLVAGLQGKEGTLRIGKPIGAEADEAPDPRPRQFRASNIGVGIVGILVGIAAILLFAL